jgi:hypothetical protein
MPNTTGGATEGKTMGTIWFKGDELTITSDPFMLHGGEFVTAVNDEGKEFTVATRAQQNRNAADRQSEWKKQQAEFAKLA